MLLSCHWQHRLSGSASRCLGHNVVILWLTASAVWECHWTGVVKSTSYLTQFELIPPKCINKQQTITTITFIQQVILKWLQILRLNVIITDKKQFIRKKEAGQKLEWNVFRRAPSIHVNSIVWNINKISCRIFVMHNKIVRDRTLKPKKTKEIDYLSNKPICICFQTFQ